jgi:DNA-binding XRE family transcriptional regulator
VRGENLRLYAQPHHQIRSGRTRGSTGPFPGVSRRATKAGLSQEELGFRTELDRTYVSGIERGMRNPTLWAIARLAKGLNTRPSEIFLQAEKSF